MLTNDRNLNLDYTKGFLVICMVIYHSITYFTTTGYDGTKYIRFVTGSFIFISGYIVSVFYHNKFIFNKVKTSKRLITRGLKLIFIFTFLNIIISLAGIQSHKFVQYDINLFLQSLRAIYVQGNSIYAVFQILVPIAYFLFLSPLLLFFQNRKKTIMLLTILLLLIHVMFNISSFNLYGLLIGLVGFSVGFISVNQEQYAIKQKIFILLLFFISILLMPFFDKNIIFYSSGIIIILKLVYDFSITQNVTKHFNKFIVILGQYSLLNYLMQIFFLQGLYQLFIKHRFDLGYESFVIFVITNIFLIFLCLLLDLLRNRFRIIDKSYKLIFA